MENREFQRKPRDFWILIGVVVLWMLLATAFIARSPAGAFSHDTHGHVQNTRILYFEHRLPNPREGWETYQPPLYYLVNTLLLPGHESHIFWVRLASAVYGAAALCLISVLLTRCKVLYGTQAAVL